jgi:hypothetical protein
MASSRTGRLLATGGFLKPQIKIWKVTDRELELLRVIRVDQRRPHVFADALSFSPDGRLLATGTTDGVLRLWRTEDGTLASELEGHTKCIYEARFSPSGTLIATVGPDALIRLWDVQRGALRATLEGHTGTVWQLGFLPDGKTLISTGADKTVRLWDVESARPLAKLTRHRAGVWKMAISPMGDAFATGDDRNVVLLWRVADRRATHEFRGAPSSPAFSPDGRWLAIPGWRGLEVYSVGDGKLAFVGPDQEPGGYGVTFAPAGNTAVTSGDQGFMYLWTIPPGNERAQVAARR